jgi:Mor family transcriptional regulator
MRNFKYCLSDIPKQHRELASLLGIDVYIQFCNLYGGSNIYIPTIKTLNNSARKDDILGMFENGQTIKEIAREFNLSTNYIRYILKKNLAD